MAPGIIDQDANNHCDQVNGDERCRNRAFARMAQEAACAEKTMSALDAIKCYPKAVGWSIIISTCVIMDGYDSSLITNFLAFPSFQRQFGDFVGVTQETPSGYQLKPEWAAALTQAAVIGFLLGVLLNGYLSPKFGSKRVVLGALVVMSAFLLTCFFAQSVQVLFAGQILCGLTWGILTTIAPAYASEVMPITLRPYMTSYINICYLAGSLLSVGILKSFSSRIDRWGYRIPFSLQWIWPAFLIPVIWYAPESPWYLVRQGRLDEAEKSLRRLRGHNMLHKDSQRILATIVYTNDLEERLSIGTSYWHCFKGSELRRTEIACLSSAGQIFSGLLFGLNSSYFFEAVGLGTNTTYSLTLGGLALGVVGALINWFALMPRLGRRTIYIWGMASISLIWCLVGVLNVWTNLKPVTIIQAVLSLAWTFMYNLSVGQLGWALPAEIGSTRLRQKTVCLGRFTVAVIAIGCGFLQQYMLSTNVAAGGWNLRGYAGFVWCGTALVMTIWAFFRLPETRDRSFHELDILFAKGVPARKMASTMIDAFDEHEISQLAPRNADVGPTQQSKLVATVTSASIGDPIELAQRRASTTNSGESTSLGTVGSVTVR